ncbi:hypothetical protein K402DRAFT_417811 [Aulographum hederae CBS 113979]|uniref:Uncharacterized protein n=1 Tax=Aulographum hederae CBS 113979 TaxID=1176131 RepID=A0A6G1HBD2_9PEZI|nr:hypothetical protein K402DRAFT_417811 [Aulographum hederae CBS 113979]
MAARSFFAAAVLLSSAYAQQTQGQFNQVINLNGDMNLNSITFPDNTKIETFSQTQRQIIVNQNSQPLPGNQVTGSTGQPFVALAQQSLIVETNGATDLVGGQMELAMNQQMMQQMNVNPDNAFVGKLAQDRRTWTIMENIRSVNITDMTVRMVKMNSMDGEYMVLGRQTPETSLALTQFNGQTVAVNSSGIQEAEFTDGFRMSIRSTMPMTFNTQVKNGISSTMLPQQDMRSVNNFRYLVTTNLAGVLPDSNRMAAVVQLPLNAVRVQQMAMASGANENSNIVLGIAQRPVLNNPGGAQPGGGQLSPQRRSATKIFPRQNGSTTNVGNPAATQLLLAPSFTPIAANAVLDRANGRIAVPVNQINGEFIITMQMNAQQQQQGQQPQAEGQRPQEGGQPAPQAEGQRPQEGGQPAPQAEGQRPQEGGQPAPANEPQAGAPGAPAPQAEAGAPGAPGAPGAAAPVAAVAAAPVSSITYKRQAPAAPMTGAIQMSMAEINEMANIERNGGAVDVGAMLATVMTPAVADASAPIGLDSFGAAPAATAPAPATGAGVSLGELNAPAPAGGAGVSLGSLKRRSLRERRGLA